MLCVIVLLSITTLVLGFLPSALEVSVKVAASTVASVDDIVIGAVVYNPTDEDIRVIAKNNILDTSPTRSFTVRSENDGIVFFTGVRAMYDLFAGSIYMTIPAGGYVVVNHANIGALYDFESFGTGTFTFAPIALFQTGPDTPPEVVDVPPIKVEITHDVKRRYPFPRFPEPCSDVSKSQVLQDSFYSFRAIAQEVYADFQSSPPEQMTTYFSGGEIINEYLTIDFLMLLMGHYDFDVPITCDLDPAGVCGVSGDVIAYTIARNDTVLLSGDIYTCDTFYDSVGTIPSVCNGFSVTTSSREGVFVHEFINLLAGTFSEGNTDMRDVAYGCSAVTSLSAEDQYSNPDNYRCLVMAVYCGSSSRRRLDEV